MDNNAKCCDNTLKFEAMDTFMPIINQSLPIINQSLPILQATDSSDSAIYKAP